MMIFQKLPGFFVENQAQVSVFLKNRFNLYRPAPLLFFVHCPFVDGLRVRLAGFFSKSTKVKCPSSPSY
jgi:hypothetical protein